MFVSYVFNLWLRDHLCPLPDLGLFVPMSVRCVRFSIYCYCCFLVSNIYLLNNIDRWPVLFCLPFLVVSFISLQMCSSRKCGWNSSLQSPSISNPLLPLWRVQFLDPKRMVLYVPTWEVLEDGNVGLHSIMSVPFQLIPFRLQLIYSACYRMLILLLQFLTPFIALTGRSRWLACLKSPIILWLP